VPQSGPLVSFVVPCYRLGHLVGDCLQSILRQTYRELEVLVMDDCSPDDTPAIVGAIADSRIQYVRNEQNLGHLRNYNKGIELSRGKYVWLISADDLLRDATVVERFVDALEKHPSAGYVFCPAVRFNASGDIGIYGSHGDADWVRNGRDVLRRWLVEGNSVPAAAGMVRKVCYERLGGFPLDLPFAGDWYMWSIFALHFDVAYVAAPMAGYRAHDGNMTLDFKRRAAALVDDMLRVLWRMKGEVTTLGHRSLSRRYLRAIAAEYAARATRETGDGYRMPVHEIEDSLVKFGASRREGAYIRAHVNAMLGDFAMDDGNLVRARAHYRAAVTARPMWLRTRVKDLLARGNSTGARLRCWVVRYRAACRQACGSVVGAARRELLRLGFLSR
jgi:glycosyltransferase involved in cell wall biosynthesis